MENWVRHTAQEVSSQVLELTPFQGLITGRTAIFSADPANASIREKRMVANVMSHEVAHMWYDKHIFLGCVTYE